MRDRWTALLLACVLASLLIGGCLGPNRPPVALFTFNPALGYAPLPVAFDASGSYDVDGRIASYLWDFGDGKSTPGKKVEHAYAAAGTYTITLTVRDSRGAEDSTSEEVVAAAVPANLILRRYAWTWHDPQETWQVLLPKGLYERYHAQTRPPLAGNDAYTPYVLDPLDDPTLQDLAAELGERAGSDPDALLDFALAFVQGAIRYADDPPGVDYPLYPLETLVDGAGDCEDTTILYVSLLRAAGRSATIGFVDTDSDRTPDHVLALVPVSATYPTPICPPGTTLAFWTLDGKRYALAETTGRSSGPLPLGCDPWGLTPEDLIAHWDL
jgi:PKD repeat protein